MAHYSALIFRSGSDAAQNSVGELFQSHMGGALLSVEAPRKASAHLSPYSQRFRPEKLEELYCTVAASPDACTVSVAADCAGAMCDFLAGHPGTAADFSMIVCAMTPDQQSQEATIRTMRTLRGADADPTRVHVLLVNVAQEMPVQSAFRVADEYVKSAGFPNATLDAILHESPAYERARELQLSVSSILNAQVDFGKMLAEARQAGGDEKTVRELASRLLAQRALLGIRSDIDHACSALGLPRISRQAWLEEAARIDASRQRSAVSSFDDEFPSNATPSEVADVVSEQ